METEAELAAETNEHHNERDELSTREESQDSLSV